MLCKLDYYIKNSFQTKKINIFTTTNISIIKYIDSIFRIESSFLMKIRNYKTNQN